jgi:hypothetical protein
MANVLPAIRIQARRKLDTRTEPASSMSLPTIDTVGKVPLLKGARKFDIR